jgi:hypothetical protein
VLGVETVYPADALAAAEAALARGDVDGTIAQLSAAIRTLTDAGENRAAAMVCLRLGDVFANMLGSKVGSTPWYVRAGRLLEAEAPCREQGHAALAAIGCDVDDPGVLIERADFALDLARKFGDVDLEIKALADGGLGHVQAGNVSGGMAMEDEAMALACGGGTTDAEIVGKAVCSFFTACYYAADFERVELWRRALRQTGLIGPAPGPPAVLRSHCDSVQGILLCHLGQWGEAERVLTTALADIEDVMPGSAWHPPIALAELRILQGRLTEAEALLLGRDDHVQALLPMARLVLARGDWELALVTARRGLRMIGDDRVRATALLSVVVEASLGLGDVAAAAAASADLDERAAGLALPLLDAEAARVRARVQVATGDQAAALATIQGALECLADANLPRVKFLLHLDLARLLDDSAARVEAKAARALLARLDVAVSPEDVALLDRLVPPPAAAPGACVNASLTFAGSWCTAACGGTTVRLPVTKGLRYLAVLVARPGVERHAFDLVDVVEGVGDTNRRALGDAGTLLDAAGRLAYRKRVTQLRDEVADALAAEDDEKAQALQQEIDSLVHALAEAFGLGGRERKAGSAAEKSRLNVTRALRAAIAKLSDALPEGGAVLDRRVRTGLFCVYEPAPDDQVAWKVFSAD